MGPAVKAGDPRLLPAALILSPGGEPRGFCQTAETHFRIQTETLNNKVCSSTLEGLFHDILTRNPNIQYSDVSCCPSSQRAMVTAPASTLLPRPGWIHGNCLPLVIFLHRGYLVFSRELRRADADAHTACQPGGSHNIHVCRQM